MRTSSRTTSTSPLNESKMMPSASGIATMKALPLRSWPTARGTSSLVSARTLIATPVGRAVKGRVWARALPAGKGKPASTAHQGE